MNGTRRHNCSLATLVVLGLLLPLASCDREKSAAAPEHAPDPAAAANQARTTLTLNGHRFSVEVAATDADRNRGLMYRKSLPADAGMIFIFRDEKPLSFWMHNTLIPLDIVYLDSQCRIVSIKQMKPLDDSAVPSDGPARMAIELNVGTAARIGLKAGDVVSVPPEVQNPPNLE